jgi:nucleoside-diphosphate-sugar epimerase
MERRAKRRGDTTPPLVNKARYKFLGLNLDYSIAKARRILGYEPPFSTEQGLQAALAELRQQPAGETAGITS